MALTPPAWCVDATPTRRGWVDPRTGELLKAQRISDIDIMEYNGVPQQVVEQVVHEPLRCCMKHLLVTLRWKV